METFIVKIAVAVIPLVILVASVAILSKLSAWYAHHPLSWHRTRRQVLHALASGVLFR